MRNPVPGGPSRRTTRKTRKRKPLGERRSPFANRCLHKAPELSQYPSVRKGRDGASGQILINMT